MNKKVELPLVEPMGSTFHYQAQSTAVIADNPSIRNWILNEVIMLRCTTEFLSGLTTPQIGICQSSWKDNPYLELVPFDTRFTKGFIHPIIRELLDNGYYVSFRGVDDYYVEGKSWYQRRHFEHDGLICGYNREDKTYCVYAYDSDWKYQKFWTPQKAFEAGRMAMVEKGCYGEVSGIKPMDKQVEFDPAVAVHSIREFLNNNRRKYPKTTQGEVLGIAVQHFIAMYIDRLYEGAISYARMDWRILRLIWEHKKIMLERIEKIEQALHLNNRTSAAYKRIVSEADAIRMLYASHHMRRRDAVLPTISHRLREFSDSERRILRRFIKKAEEAMRS